MGFIRTAKLKSMVLFPDGKGSFPVVMVGGVLEANRSWDVGREVINAILKTYSGACPIRPKVSKIKSFV